MHIYRYFKCILIFNDNKFFVNYLNINHSQCLSHFWYLKFVDFIARCNIIAIIIAQSWYVILYQLEPHIFIKFVSYSLSSICCIIDIKQKKNVIKCKYIIKLFFIIKFIGVSLQNIINFIKFSPTSFFLHTSKKDLHRGIS